MSSPAKSPGAFRFGTFEVDLLAGELRKSDRRVRIQEQPFRILVLLLERPGEIVSRDYVIQRLWPDGTFVDYEHSVNTAIRKLRDALGDDPDSPRFVETVPRRGYRFLGQVERSEEASPAGVSEQIPGGSSDSVSVRAEEGFWVAVLPFKHKAADAGLDALAEGITEEIITGLSRFSYLRVIARSSSETFSSESGDVRPSVSSSERVT
jgi:DNA-binding winged helix-turn-helix (wHTH) protein